MKTQYKLPLHIKNYVKQELYDYKNNKKIVQEIQNQNASTIITKSLLIATNRISQIENVYQRLSKEEQELMSIIFFQRTNQSYAETYFYISKDAYYRAMNKIIYITAMEFELI